MPNTKGGRGCRGRFLRGVVPAAVLAVGGLTASPGVGPAVAADTLSGTQIDIPLPMPVPITDDNDPVPDAPAGGGGSSPTTAPAAPPGEGAPSSGDAGSGSATPTTASADAGSGARATTRPRTRARSASVSPATVGTPTVSEPIVDLDENSGEATVERLREASVPAARQFSLPLALGALVLAFLAIQGRVDKRDPKLTVAPVTMADDLLPFA